MEERAFALRSEGIGQLINEQRWLEALRWAQTLVDDAPERAQSYNLLNVAVCLTGRDGGARRRSPELIERARQCDDATDILIGDMLRDRAIGLIRTPRRGLDTADVILAARRYHFRDQNRMACLQGVEGRLQFSRGDYGAAVELHRRADERWRTLNGTADPQWVYNNYIHWLRAVVAQHGRDCTLAAWLVRDIQTKCPPGARNRTREATVIMLPGGLRLYDLATRLR